MTAFRANINVPFRLSVLPTLPTFEEYCRKVARCECGCLKPTDPSRLVCDEIARGIHQQKALDKPFAFLVVRWDHHAKIQDWSRAKRLALLYLARPSDYDLEAFWELTKRRFPSQEEVDVEIALLLGQTH